MAIDREIYTDPDTGQVTYYLGGDEVDARTWVLTDPGAKVIYEKVMATGLWKFNEAEQFAFKTSPGLKNFYDADVVASNPNYNSVGINQNPNTGGPETDAEREKRLKAEEAAALAKAEQLRKETEKREEELDWRVRLHLADEAQYLYKAPTLKERGILDPLRETKGIIFPYTPTIGIQYNASYADYQLVHSNYKGYFYTGSSVPTVLVTADFTANDLYEANYLLASLHFLRSCTKMFYGQDAKRGMPPPVVFLTGYGEYQFKNHPCVITMVNYNLPNDVDYIPAGEVEGESTQVPPSKNPINGVKETRTTSLGIDKSQKPLPKSDKDPNKANTNKEKIHTYRTYVPTKITINFTMVPIQTRSQVSNDFSLEKYGSGELLKKGLW